LGTEQGIPSDDAMPPNVSGLLPMHNTKLAEIQQKQCRIVPTLLRIGGSQSSKGGASAFEDLEQQKNHPHLDFFLVASEYISAGETLWRMSCIVRLHRWRIDQDEERWTNLSVRPIVRLGDEPIHKFTTRESGCDFEFFFEVLLEVFIHECLLRRSRLDSFNIESVNDKVVTGSLHEYRFLAIDRRIALDDSPQSMPKSSNAISWPPAWCHRLLSWA
jgi:hypothetical protein